MFAPARPANAGPVPCDYIHIYDIDSNSINTQKSTGDERTSSTKNKIETYLEIGITKILTAKAWQTAHKFLKIFSPFCGLPEAFFLAILKYLFY